MGILDQLLEEEEAFLAFLRFPLLLAAQYFDRYCRLIRDLWILYGPLWCHQKNLLLLDRLFLFRTGLFCLH